jgi:hypothetical protein
MRKLAALAVTATYLGGCASSSVLDMNSNTIQISTSAAPVCGQSGTQNVAVKRAAIETLARGYDAYVIEGSGYANNIQLHQTGPTYATTTTRGTLTPGYGNIGYSGQSTTTFGGNQVFLTGRHQQNIQVHMFRSGEPGVEQAIDARKILGPDWKAIVEKGPGATC